MNRILKITILILLLAIGGGCVYYNLFYNVRKSFNDAESKRKNAGRSTSSVAGKGQYRKAIEKSQIVLDKHPNSKYYDDALFVNGVSHYWTENYRRAEKRFRELMANFPESEYYKESRLYLAKAKLKLNEEDDAMTLFKELYYDSKEKWIKADAAFVLGEYFTEKRDYTQAETYYLSIIDSLGNEEEKILARLKIADGLFRRFRYKQALELYGDILKVELSVEDEYLAMFRSGECLYFMNDIEGGMEYFNQITSNDMFYDSLPAVKLMIAQGYDWDGEIELARDVYEEVAVESPRSSEGSFANYMLGLIYQFDFEDYKKAKEYYDKAKSAGRSSDIFNDALERSANIGKLEEYMTEANQEFDSMVTADEINRAAETQYLLSELYLTKMDRPDSAIQEFQYIADNFPQSYIAPKAMIALAVMNRDYHNDTTAFDSLLEEVLQKYPHSDFIPDALELKGFLNTPADTGYAEQYYNKAEGFIFDNFNYDSVNHYLSIIVDRYTDSRLYEKARFALLWMNEEFNSPGDSSLYYAYQEFVDSFPDSEYGREAGKKLALKTRRTQRDFEEDVVYDDSLGIEDSLYASGDDETDNYDDIDLANRGPMTLEERCSIGPDGETIWEVQEGPYKYEHVFRYPPSAYSLAFEGKLCFQVRIDPFGYVEDILLVTPTEAEDLNNEALETVQSGQFKTYWIQPEYADQWFLFKYKIDLPASLR